MLTIPPPRSREELLMRARALAGQGLDAIAEGMRAPKVGGGLHEKGAVGQLIERALGATGGSRAEPDFPAIGVELKTVPVDDRGKPRESTYVCTLPLERAAELAWETSWVREKLARVLFVPVIHEGDAPTRLGSPVAFSPTEKEEALLRADFDEIVGLVGAGGVEAVSARVGVVMQLRPKAASSRVRTVARDGEGGRILVNPRGFYLRPSFVAAILAPPRSWPSSDPSR